MFVQSSLANAILPVIEYFPFYFEKKNLHSLVYTNKKKRVECAAMGIDEARNGFFFSVLLVGQRRPYKEKTSTIIHRAWMMRVVAAAETAGVVHQWSCNVLLQHPQQKEKRLAFPSNQSHKSFSLLTAVIIQTTTTTDKKRKKRIDGKLFPLLRLHKNTNENKRTAFRRRVLIHHRVCVSVWI